MPVLRVPDGLGRDVRYGCRTLVRNPGFALLVVATLGLGIGVNTAIFSVINGVLLRPLPYADGAELVVLRQSAPGDGRDDIGISIRELYDYREQVSSLADLVEYHSMSFILLSHGEPDRVATGVVSSNFFDVLGVTPLVGRGFVDADDDLGAEAVLLLSWPYWQQKFGGDPDIVGQVFRMNDKPHTVIGVLPNLPQYPRVNDVYMPTSACPFRSAAELRMHEDRRAFSGLRAFGRVGDRVGAAQLEADLASVAGRFREEYPSVYRAESSLTATFLPLQAELTREARPMLLVLLATAVLVLLIACANVANITLARTMRRERELAMRTALGAGRGRLLRQLLTESTLVAVTGGVLGLALAWLTLDLLAVFVGRFTPRTMQIGIDGSVLAFTAGISIVTGLVFGVVPALTSPVSLVDALKDGGAQGGESARRHRLRDALVVAQVAVSFVLLIGAGLLLASFYRLERTSLGFQPERVMTAEVFPNWSKRRSPEELSRLRRDLLGRLERQPSIVSAAITNAVPLTDLQPAARPFRIAGRPAGSDERWPEAALSVASPSYFATLGVGVRRGRAFTDLDHAEAPRVVVINEAMARYWQGVESVGSEITLDDETWMTVVGVVADVRTDLGREAGPRFYVPADQFGGAAGSRILVRTSAGSTELVGRAIKEAVHAVDPEQPVERITTMLELRDERLATPRLTATLLALFAGLALVITVAGITGVVGTSVSQRTREFGVRMALGASPGQVLWMVIGQGVCLVLVGIAIGVAGSIGFGRVLGSYLYATEPTDPTTFVLVGVAVLAAAIVACLGPARRATTIDPMIALRTE